MPYKKGRAQRRYYRFHTWMLNGHPGNVTRDVKRIIVRGVNHGLVVTSTTGGTHAPTSYHYSGNAVDMAGAGTAHEQDFQNDLIRYLGPRRFNEIFGPDNDACVKDGVRITLGEGTPLEEQHDTHIHVAPRGIPALSVPQSVRDRWLAAKLRRLGAKWALDIIRESRREQVPLAWALALVQQESDFRHIFGGDHGNLPDDYRAPFYRVPVSKPRVAELLRWVAQGHASNGVGLTQLTSVGYIVRANRAGGAHVPKVNIRVGLQVLREKTGGDYANDAWKYNGDRAYQAQIEAKQRRWAGALRSSWSRVG